MADCSNLAPNTARNILKIGVCSTSDGWTLEYEILVHTALSLLASRAEIQLQLAAVRGGGGDGAEAG